MENKPLAFEIPITVSSGKPFDGMAFGTFVDMFGREAVLDVDDAEVYIANTTANIEATRGESGAVAGLPIDAVGHNHGEAAGWIVAVELGENDAGKVIRFTPRWTELGLEVLSTGKLRFFSPEVDIENKVIVGGSLTNWPATRTAEGRILLRPVELSQQRRQSGTDEDTNMSDANTGTAGPITLEALSDEARTQLMAEVREEIEAANAAETAQAAQLEQLKGQLISDLNMATIADAANLDEARAALSAQLERALRGELERLEAQSGQMLQSLISDLRAKDRAAALAVRLSQGDADHTQVLPVERARIEKFLLSLNTAQRKEAAEILSAVQENGLVSLEEQGHGRQTKGVTPLPADIAAELRAGTLQLSDLRSPILAPAIGDLEQYDLSEFEVKE